LMRRAQGEATPPSGSVVFVEPASFVSKRRRTIAAAVAAPTIFHPGTGDYYVGTFSGLGRLYLEPTPGEVDRRPSSR
jgi:hypothetical protein